MIDFFKKHFLIISGLSLLFSESFLASYVGKHAEYFGLRAPLGSIYISALIGFSACFLLFLALSFFYQKNKCLYWFKIVIKYFVLIKLFDASFKVFFLVADLSWLGIYQNEPNLQILMGKTVWNFLPILLGLVLIFFNKITYKAFSFFAFFALVFFVVISVRVCKIHALEIENIQHTKIISNELKRQVIWVIFDEFDPEIAFSHPNLLPTFARLMKESVQFKSLYSLSKDTMTSIPATIMASPVIANYRINNNSLEFTGLAEKTVKFSHKNSLFERLNMKNYSSAILGFYHPYCKIFDVAFCKDYGLNYDLSIFDGLYHVLYKITGVKKFKRSIANESWDQITNHQISSIPEILNRKDNLIYLHLNIPHLPARVAASHYGEEPKTKNEQYKLNLKLADETLSLILKSIPNDGKEKMIILNSDHWYREKDQKNHHPALGVIKILSDNKKYQIENPTSNLYMSNLIIDFLDKKIEDNNDIKEYFKDKTYHETFIPKK